MAMVRVKALGPQEQCVKRFRRRQSDARWRANLASCYETLKLVIPLTTRASKKQISKVVQLYAVCKLICYTKLHVQYALLHYARC